MKYKTFFYPLLIFFLLSACSKTKRISELTEKGDAAYKVSEYSQAMNHWEELVSILENKNKKPEAILYVKMGNAALKSEQYDKAQKYFEKADNTDFSDAKMYAGLAECYRKIDNLSKEITALENYVRKYPEGKDINELRTRLFETYVESENWEKALELWPQLTSETQSDIKIIEGFFKTNQALGNNKTCEDLAKKLLEKDKNNVVGLEFTGKKYYLKAENRYQAELKAYEKNKTRKQYSKLLKAFKIVAADFKKARFSYLKLYSIEPLPNYATYLANIYARLNDKKKSDYYRKKSKNKQN